MAILTPDKTTKINGVTVKQYFITTHNPNKISMPTTPLPQTIRGVTIHNTEAINVASNTTMAEQYTRATVNGAMNSVRVHFYVDDVCAWQCLPLTLSGWHAADGNGDGNRKTISMEVIGNSAKAEENAMRLAAALLAERNLNVNFNLFTHTHWLNVKDGKTGSIDFLNTDKNSYKWCPVYILPHWTTFKNNVANEITRIKGTTAPAQEKKEEVPNTTPTQTTELYRIRQSWSNVNSQIGAYSNFENAKKEWKEGYFIYNSKGEAVYPVETKPDVFYQVYTNQKWLPQVKNCDDYAGIERYSIRGLTAKSTKGTLVYRVHLENGGWLGWISNYNLNDWYNGYAGILNQYIDAIQMRLEGVPGYEVKYRVSNVSTKEYYDWVVGDSDYAGSFKNRIDKVQIEIVKL